MTAETVSLPFASGQSGWAFTRARSLAQAVAFWVAVALPLAYLPLVVATPATVSDPTLLGWALGGNLVAIVVGHGHEPSLGRRGSR